MKPPRISVVITTYNRKELLEGCIQSIVDQTYPAHEIIISDDGSTDGTREFFEHTKFIAGTSIIPIKYFWHKNVGPGLAKNLGNKKATGDIIISQDSDDVSFPDRLEKIADYFIKNPKTDIFYHAAYLKYTNKERNITKRIFYPTFPFSLKRLLNEPYIDGSLAYRREKVLKIPYHKCFDDWLLEIEFALQGCKFGYIDDALLDRGWSPDSDVVQEYSGGGFNKGFLFAKRLLKKKYGVDFNPEYVTKRKMFV